MAGALDDWVRHPRHGPLPALLLALTVVTGVVDAVTLLDLGRVFVGNMTGNVAFLAVALAGAPGFSLEASLVALVGFVVGAAVEQALTRRADRGAALVRVVVLEVVLVAAAAVVVAAGDPGRAVRDVAVALTAVALGAQNATARRLAVPDLTTTVLTMTITGFVVGLRDRPAAVRRFLAIAALFGGAAVGAVVVLQASAGWALLLATVLLAGVAVAAAVATGRPAGWRDG